MDKEKIIRYYKSTGDEIIAARLVDLAEAVEKSKKYKASSFLSPNEMQIAEVIANSADSLQVNFAGGFASAERNKAIFVYETFDFPIADDIIALEINWDKRYYNLAHRDVLGALVTTCKRECLGDIRITETGAQAVVDKKISEFILSNLTKIGAAEVTLHIIPLTDLEQKQEKIKQISTTVATLRLDAVAASGYGVSRTQMAESIKMQQVKVNHKPAKNPAQDVKPGDIISYRGRGRVEVISLNGLTKKGRISLTINRIL